MRIMPSRRIRRRISRCASPATVWSPYIHDDSIVLVKRGATIYDGDIGLFFVDGDMKCKQYCQDYLGNVYLFSLNRARKDADVTISASSGITICCFGKVLLKGKIPLPQD